MKRRILFYLGWQLTLAVFLLSAGIHVSCQEATQGSAKPADDEGTANSEIISATDAGCDDPTTYDSMFTSQHTICIDAGGGTASTIDICQTNTIQTTIQAAIDAMTSTVNKIFILDGTYNEALSFSNVDDRSLIGCTRSGVIVGNPTSPIVGSYAVNLQSATNISFYNMTLQGIGGSYSATGSETDTELSNAATFYANASSFTLSNVGLENNFYQAIKLADATSNGTLSTVDLSSPYSASNASSISYATSIGIWNEGGLLSVSGLTFGSTFDTGIVSDGGTLTLTSDNTFSGMYTPIYLANDATLSTSSDLASTLITSSIVGIWSEDMSLSLSHLTMDGTNTYDLIGCQTTGTDPAAATYSLNYNSFNTLVFGTVTVGGGGSSSTAAEINSLGTVYVDMNETTVLKDQFAAYSLAGLGAPYIVSCDRGDY